MHQQSFVASELISTVKATPLLGCPEWQDIEFIAKRDAGRSIFVGCGLYCTAFNGRLIYVGKFLGSTKSPFSGNLLDIRWLRHLPSLSLRGRRICISRRSLERLTQELKHPELRQGLQSADPSVLVHDRGYLASYNRVRFAEKHWEILRNDAEQFLGLFELGYVRIESEDVARLTHTQIRAVVTDAETHSRKTLEPCCNGEVNFERAWVAPGLNLQQSMDALEQALVEQLSIRTDGNREQCTYEATSGAYVRDAPPISRKRQNKLEADTAMEHIEDDLPQGWPLDLLMRLRTALPANTSEVHATATQPRGDVRVRVLDIKRPRNIFTMAWQPRLGQFLCRIHLDKAFVDGQPGCTDVRNVVNSLRTSFHFDAQDHPEATNRLFRLIGKAAQAAREECPLR